jgi:hypothetical protein
MILAKRDLRSPAGLVTVAIHALAMMTNDRGNFVVGHVRKMRSPISECSIAAFIKRASGFRASRQADLAVS